jgi:hypothetical protein
VTSHPCAGQFEPVGNKQSRYNKHLPYDR